MIEALDMAPEGSPLYELYFGNILDKALLAQAKKQIIRSSVLPYTYNLAGKRMLEALCFYIFSLQASTKSNSMLFAME